MENLISKSIEQRAIILFENGMDMIEAVKKAIIEENKLIEEIVSQESDRSKNVKNQICKNVYGLIHIMH